MSKIYGYARVSTQKQSLEYQIKALKDYGCDEIFQDTFTGKTFSRDGLVSLLEKVQTGDTVVVTKFDRLGRNLKGLLDLFEQFDKQGIRVISITQGFDTGTATGRLLFQIMGAVAEFERELTKERTYFALQKARNEKKLGRPSTMNAEKYEAIQSLVAAGHGLHKALSITGITRYSYYRYLKSIGKK